MITITINKNTGNYRMVLYENIIELKELGLNVSQIARHLKVSRNTIYKYVNAIPEIILAEKRERKKKLDQYQDEILLLLQTYSDLSAAQILSMLRKQFGDIDVSLSTAGNYVRMLREKYDIPKKAFQ